MTGGKTVRLLRPTPKQEQFLQDTHRYVAYGGARGGGKSEALRMKAVLLALRWPGIRILIVRRTYQEVINNHVPQLKECLGDVARFYKTDKEFRFTNSSMIKLGYCDKDGDLDQYQGVEYDVIFLDEACQLLEEWIRKINACIRGVNGFPKRTYYTLNPGGPSHGYFKRVFVDRDFRKGERPEDYSFIQARVTDNLPLMRSQPDYVENLKLQTPRIRAMWLEGSWDIYAGQFFEDFVTEPPHDVVARLGISAEKLRAQRRYTHVIEPFDIPDGWNVFRSYDWGYNKPFSCGWWAVDYDGVIYRILELYGCRKDAETGEDEPNEGVKWDTERQMKEIARIEREHPWLRGRKIRGVADPSCWDASHGPSTAEIAAREGVYFDKGDNQRLPGWMQVHYRLAFDEDGYAQMYIFRGCSAFIRTIPLLMYDQHMPEDLDTSMEDHVADEVRYFCMSRPIRPNVPVKQPAILADPLEQYAGDMRKYTDARRIRHG